MSGDYNPSNLRYVAPECLEEEPPITIKRPSKESDVYSLAMTSFKVCPSTTNDPAT
jgi:hypothetical protein